MQRLLQWGCWQSFSRVRGMASTEKPIKINVEQVRSENHLLEVLDQYYVDYQHNVLYKRDFFRATVLPALDLPV